MTTTTPNSQQTTPKKVGKQHYDTHHRSRVQGVHAFLVAKEIPLDEREIFEFFNVEPRAGYRMLEPGASSRTFHHSVEVETRGRKRKVTSDQVREADAILQDDSFGFGSERIVMAAVGYRSGGRCSRKDNAFCHERCFGL